jgi:PAS domain S-box-containing protein
MARSIEGTVHEQFVRFARWAPRCGVWWRRGTASSRSRLPVVSPAAAPDRPVDPFEGVGRSAIHAAFEAIITVDEEYRVVMINPAALRMFGYSTAEALGSELSRFMPSRFGLTHAAHVRQFDRSGAVELPMGARGTVVGLRANGDEFALEASICRVDVHGPAGARRYFTALLRDVSEAQAIEAEIEVLNRRVRAIFELAPIAIWITDEDRIVFANRACTALFGAPAQATLIGRSIYSLLAPESQAPVRQKVEQALASGTPVPLISERIARLDGEVREVEIAVAGLPDHGRTALQMVITDITERAREGREIKRSRRELRQLSASLVNAREEERRRIARELHDELGQQLTALKMELASLGTQAMPGAPTDRIAALCEMVDQTVVSVRRIAADLRPLMLDDLGLVAAIEWLARESGRRLGIDILLRLGDTDPPVGEAATIALYRMVQEALTNIARHAHATEVSIEMRLVGTELVLTVQDNGGGLTPESMYREGSHGLMGARERAYMLGGTLEIGSTPGGGGRVTVRLPLVPADAPAEPAAATPLQRLTAPPTP